MKTMPAPADVAAVDTSSAAISATRRFGLGWTSMPGVFVLLAIGYLLVAPNAFNTPISISQDGWVFNTVFMQLARGLKLYRDVFDHKDPLYFYPYSIFTRLFGPAGPMICETLLGLLTIAVLLALARRLGAPVLVAGACVLLYLLFYYNAAIYFPLNTYHVGLLLFAASLLFAAQGRGITAGAFFAAAVWSKMTLAPYLPASLALLLLPVLPQWPVIWSRARRWLIGAAGLSAALAVVMAMRGELGGYVEAIRLNFSYSDILSRTLGLSNHPLAATEGSIGMPLVVLLGLGGLATFGFALVELRRQLTAGRADPRQPNLDLGLMGATVFTGIAGAIVLHEGAWFGHYMECLAPLAFLVPLSLINGVRRYVRPSLGRVPAVLAVVLACCLAMWGSGRISAEALTVHRPHLTFLRLHTTATDPNFLACQASFPALKGQEIVYAEVGTNHYVAACSTTPNMHLGCRLFSQFPWFGTELLDEFQSCLATTPQVVFVSPLLFESPQFLHNVDTILQTRFTQIGVCGPVQIWERKPGR